MAKIKGLSLKNGIEYHKQRFGNEAFQRILDELTYEEQQTLSGFISDSQWYPLDYYIHFIDSVLKNDHGNDEESFKKATGAVVEHQFRGVYKSLLMIGSAEGIVERFGKIINRYFEGIHVTIKKIDRGKVQVTCKGFEKNHRNVELVIAGWWEKVLELMKVTNIRVDITTSIGENKGFLKMDLSWDKK